MLQYKTIGCFLWLLCCFYLGTTGPVISGEPSAANLVSQALERAANSKKEIIVTVGNSKCGWCVLFEKYYKRASVKRVLDKYFVIVTIDTIEMKDGKAVYSKFSEPRAPSWVILDSNSKVLIDSFINGVNIGYPAKPDEVTYYIDALKKAQPALTYRELETLASELQDNTRN